MTIKQILSKYPKAHLHYWDSGSWVFYTSKKALEKRERYEDKEYDKYMEEITLLEGDDNDFQTQIGYAPGLVVQFAKLLGLTIDSI